MWYCSGTGYLHWMPQPCLNTCPSQLVQGVQWYFSKAWSTCEGDVNNCQAPFSTPW
jgi:hypothetical protein